MAKYFLKSSWPCLGTFNSNEDGLEKYNEVQKCVEICNFEIFLTFKNV